MEKGLEISFTTDRKDADEIVEALGNIVGNEFLEEMNIDWWIFHVLKGKDRFYKICFTGPKMTKLHPMVEEKVRGRFAELSREEEGKLIEKYRTDRNKEGFKRMKITRTTEEYDLWQDNFWKYF